MHSLPGFTYEVIPIDGSKDIATSVLARWDEINVERIFVRWSITSAIGGAETEILAESACAFGVDGLGEIAAIVDFHRARIVVWGRRPEIFCSGTAVAIV